MPLPPSFLFNEPEQLIANHGGGPHGIVSPVYLSRCRWYEPRRTGDHCTRPFSSVAVQKSASKGAVRTDQQVSERENGKRCAAGCCDEFGRRNPETVADQDRIQRLGTDPNQACCGGSVSARAAVRLRIDRRRPIEV